MVEIQRARRIFLAWILAQAFIFACFVTLLFGTTRGVGELFNVYASVGQVLTFGYGGGPIRCGSIEPAQAAAYATRLTWFYLPFYQVATTLLIIGFARVFSSIQTRMRAE